jgi:simple sugar transport system ATP-binding protein
VTPLLPRGDADDDGGLMIGKDLPVCEHSRAREGGEIRLRLLGLSHASDDPFGTDLRDMHLDVRSGEIVGIAGVSGNGQQELLYALSGEGPLAEKFPVQICGTEAGRMMPGRRRKAGLGFVPEERLGRGAVPSMSLAENALLTAATSRSLVRKGLIDFEAARFAAS